MANTNIKLTELSAALVDTGVDCQMPGTDKCYYLIKIVKFWCYESLITSCINNISKLKFNYMHGWVAKSMLYTGKNLQGKLLQFVVFHSILNLFPRIMALSISNISLQKCYSESFTVNSSVPLKKRQFFAADVFSYTV